MSMRCLTDIVTELSDTTKLVVRIASNAVEYTGNQSAEQMTDSARLVNFYHVINITRHAPIFFVRWPVISTKLGRVVTDIDCEKDKVSITEKSQKLALKIISGDVSAKNQFVEINYRWLLFVVRKNFPRSENQHDIVHDAFMLVLSKLDNDEIDNPDAVTAFLKQTAIYIGYDYIRKDKKYESALDQEFMKLIIDDSRDVLSALIWNDRVKYVRTVLEELSMQRDKDILLRFYFKNQDKASICREMELSPDLFDRVIHRARTRLRALIQNKDRNNPANKSQNRRVIIVKSKSGSDKGFRNYIPAIVTRIRLLLNKYFVARGRCYE